MVKTLDDFDLKHSAVHGTAFCNGRTMGRSTALPDGTARLENFRNFYLAHSTELLSGVRHSFTTQGNATLIKVAFGDAIRAVGISVFIDDCRFSAAAGYESQYNTLASAGVFT